MNEEFVPLFSGVDIDVSDAAINFTTTIVNITELVIGFAVSIGGALFLYGLFQFKKSSNYIGNYEKMIEHRSSGTNYVITSVILGLFSYFLNALHASIFMGAETNSPFALLGRALASKDSSPSDTLIYLTLSIICCIGIFFCLRGVLSIRKAHINGWDKCIYGCISGISLVGITHLINAVAVSISGSNYTVI